ncbi:hypothetical protein BSKO_07392 [Bryopsis sp. KO-2023]|nr:hypothetical protein BSKO_07392 [Bryopsis sp. KO-2023]
MVSRGKIVKQRAEDMNARSAVNTSGVANRPPKWFTPFRFTLLMSLMLFWVYLDRGAFSSTSVNGSRPTKENPEGTGIQGEFAISDFEDGLLSSVFMIGMLIASPVFSEAIHRVNAMRVLGIGLGIWTLGVLGSGLSWNYWSLVVCRSLVGCGEAAVLVLCPPFIDDSAPPDRKGIWLGIFFTTIPVGIGSGYMFGGLIGDMLHWRVTFLIEAVVMLPLVIFTLLAPPVDLNKEARPRSEDRTSAFSIIQNFFDHVGIVLSHPVYVLTVAAYTIYTGVVGLVAYWGPKMAQALFDMTSADLFMGSASAITGIIGTMLGGLLMDKLGSSIPMSLSMAGVALMVAITFLIPALMVAKKFSYFVAPFSVSTIFIFSVQAPVNAVLLWTVPGDQRALGAAMTLVSVHLFGDVPSPAAYGALLDSLKKISNNEAEAYRKTMPIVGLFMLISAIVFLVAAVVSRKAVDHRNDAVGRASGESGRPSDEEDVNNNGTDTDADAEAPLLGRAK